MVHISSKLSGKMGVPRIHVHSEMEKVKYPSHNQTTFQEKRQVKSSTIPWKNNQPDDFQMHRSPSIYRIGMNPHRNIVFYGLEIAWPADTNSALIKSKIQHIMQN